MPAGFPTWVDAVAVVSAMVENGVDVVEIGLPYSDPLMDGPVIQAAADRALAQGTTIADVLRTVEVIAATGAPTLVMSYWNPIEHYGVDRFAKDLAAAGGAGVITPDIIPEEADAWVRATDEAMIDRVFLVAPSSPEERIRAGGADQQRLRLRGLDDGCHRDPGSVSPSTPETWSPAPGGSPRSRCASASGVHPGTGGGGRRGTPTA